MDASTMLRCAAERFPSRPAVVGTGRHLTYAAWDDRVTRLALALARHGARRGDRVAVTMRGGEPLASLHLAVQRLGAVSVPLSTRFDAGETRYCVQDSGARLLVADDSAQERGRAAAGDGCTLLDAAELDRAADRENGAAPAAPAESDVAVMLYTSGTTGRPKGVPRTHRAEYSAAVAHAVQTQQRLGETVLGVMPLFHTMGLRTLLTSVLVGGTWVGQAVFDADEAVELIRANAVTSLYLVPTMYWSLVRTGKLGAADELDRLAYAGAAMTPSLAETLVSEVGPRSFVNHFGSTEIYTFTINPDVGAKPGCAGRAGIHSRVRLVDPSVGAAVDDQVRAGEQGQVIVSMASAEAFRGYWRRPDADAKAIRDGWYFTGDLAVADDDGDLWVSGRVDDMINSGGENIYPDEIEAALVRCAHVADVCVVGLPDERWGHAVTAFVVPAAGSDPVVAAQATMDFARAQLPSLKRPKRVISVDAVPRSAVGKTLRRVLAAGDYTSRGEVHV
ncbi:o-succinylbenzoate--CoA ligase [Pseudonocardia dioxanivorans CB1190]|uniref:O-succinylbenzoate--CoA ligase n=1 Tax=Pseudonocardia dioxanivorans (strain ATCC 55486 / DSM 44775 / JCM 13855 / CB1190) TaxID=675635 RepID=F4D1Z6_PSEUX|nr:AMP-binding protein [Pseudonocardia dioxanivorans]AEA28056.1 o-succinylbenzoate--CoA ligase [Pseudonocardia dioxanivorans CB1190]